MDWSSNDYAHNTDTFVLPPDSGAGVYLCNEGRIRHDCAAQDCGQTEGFQAGQARGGLASGGQARGGQARGGQAGGFQASGLASGFQAGRAEGFRAGRAEGLQAIYGVAWDGRPDSAGLSPLLPPSLDSSSWPRAWAPSWPQAPAPWAPPKGGAPPYWRPIEPSAECFGGQGQGCACGGAQYFKGFMLVMIVVLLAMFLITVGALALGIKSLIQASVEACRSFPKRSS
jgi:hypothetical protein